MLVDFGNEVGRENRIKIDQKWYRKKDEKMKGVLGASWLVLGPRRSLTGPSAGTTRARRGHDAAKYPPRGALRRGLGEGKFEKPILLIVLIFSPINTFHQVTEPADC